MKLTKDRLYYSISEVSKILDLKPSNIRFWETEFTLLKPLQKEKNAKRKFKIREIEILFKIKALLYIQGFTIKGAIDQLKNWKPVMTFEELEAALANNVFPLLDHSISSEESDFVSNDSSFFESSVAEDNHSRKTASLLIDEIRQLLSQIR